MKSRRGVVKRGAELLKSFGGLGPVVTKNARESAVREQLSTRLTNRAIVCFVGGVTDALNFCAATWTCLAITAMHGHAFTKGRHLFRKAPACFSSQTLDPMNQCIANGRVQFCDFRIT